jgi:tetratricopeptide (TPR) repeat protein
MMHRLDDALGAYQAALKLEDKPDAHNGLANVFYDKGCLDEALLHYRKALETSPDHAHAHLGLGKVFHQKGLLDAAVDAFQRAIASRKGNYPEAHCRLGLVFRQQGRFVDSLNSFKRGHELGSKEPGWKATSADWVQEAERLVQLDARLPRILKGELEPADTGERLALASLCLQYKGLYLAASRFYLDALTEQQKLEEQVDTRHYYNAACAAVLAGCGQGKDADQADDEERARLRRQALDWLNADLVANRQTFDKQPDKARPVLLQRIQHWQQDKDLAGVRGDALNQVPEAERQAWQRLWKDVEALRQRAAEPAKKAGS